jgi:tetratricopeptide (TPR) repeat protein
MPKKDMTGQGSRTVKVSSRSTAAVARDVETRAGENSNSIEASDGSKWRAIYALVPAALALLASLNALWNGFAADDISQIQNNPFIKKLSNLPLAFTSRAWDFATEDVVLSLGSYYRPLVDALFIINHAVFGESARGWHLVNVLIHTGVTLLVFVVLRSLTARPWLAAISACLFAVHPAHAEPVAWISGVTDLLMAVFLLPAFYFYLRYRESNRKHLMAVSLVFYLLALLSKETSLALPFIIAYCELFYFKSTASLKQRAIRGLTLASLFIAPTAVYFLMRYNALNAFVDSNAPRYSLLLSVATVPLALVKYLKLMLIPTGYSFQHYTALVDSATSIAFIAPVALIALLAVAVRFINSRDLKFAAAWFIITLVPAFEAMRYFDPEYLIQERYLYLPSVGFCMALALGIEWLATHGQMGSRGRIAAIASTVILVIVWGVFNVRQNGVWKDTLAINKHAVAVDPNSAAAHAALARAYFDAGRPREADAEARASLDLDPKSANPYLNLSYFARAAGKLDKSIEYLETATTEVSEGPITRQNLATVYLNLGLLYAQRKDFDRAEEKLLKSIELSPRAVAWHYTGLFYFDRKRFENARRMFEQVANRLPRWFAPVHIRLGQTYEGLNQPDRARAEYERYLELAPVEMPDRKSVENRLRQMDGNASAP